jgi:hypothetical protein
MHTESVLTLFHFKALMAVTLGCGAYFNTKTAAKMIYEQKL